MGMGVDPSGQYSPSLRFNAFFRACAREITEASDDSILNADVLNSFVVVVRNQTAADDTIEFHQ